MARLDRLSTLLNHINLNVRLAPPHAASLSVLGTENDQPTKVIFRTSISTKIISSGQILFAAIVDWGGVSNPLIAALPPLVELDLTTDQESLDLIRLMQSEITAQRCGADPVVSRLGEILIVRMLRAQIEMGSTRPGLLAGLSEPRLSRALVAIHDQPKRNWRNEDLATIAGLSLSRFSELFLAQVGEPPAAYLRRWRLTLAKQDIIKGDRVDAVARRFGYESSEGFSRAFKKLFSENPISLRDRTA